MWRGEEVVFFIRHTTTHSSTLAAQTREFTSSLQFTSSPAAPPCSEKHTPLRCCLHDGPPSHLRAPGPVALSCHDVTQKPADADSPCPKAKPDLFDEIYSLVASKGFRAVRLVTVITVMSPGLSELSSTITPKAVCTLGGFEGVYSRCAAGSRGSGMFEA